MNDGRFSRKVFCPTYDAQMPAIDSVEAARMELLSRLSRSRSLDRAERCRFVGNSSDTWTFEVSSGGHEYRYTVLANRAIRQDCCPCSRLD